MKFFTIFMFLSVLVSLAACGKKIDYDEEKVAILELYKAVNQAHFDHDAVKFLASSAEKWYSVGNGEVKIRTKQEAAPGLDQYLKNTRFLEVTDINPPVIEISEDGKTAWLIGEVKVRGIQRKKDGTEEEIAFRSSWLSIYKKDKDRWQRVATSASARDEFAKSDFREAF